MVSGPDEQVDLARASLLIASEEYPHLDVESYLGRLDALGEILSARMTSAGSSAQAVEAANRLLFGEEGFHGNLENYYDPRNSFLNDVLDRRTGIPITLSTVYMEVARRAGLEVDGVGLPGHFVVRVRGLSPEGLVDPFYGGASLSEADCQKRLDQLYGGKVRMAPWMLGRCGRKHMLARMLRNLKAVYLRAQDATRALRSVELLLLLNPWSGEDLRDRGLLYAAIGCYGLAVRDLEEYLGRSGKAPEAEELRRRIRELELRAARLN